MRLFAGRVSRGTFFQGLIFGLAGGFLFILVASFIESTLSFGASEVFFLIYFPPAFFVSVLWSLSLTIRRLHDIGHSGWLYLLYFVPLVNLGLFCFLLFRKGDPRPNAYGPVPNPSTQFLDAVLGKDQGLTVEQFAGGQATSEDIKSVATIGSSPAPIPRGEDFVARAAASAAESDKGTADAKSMELTNGIGILMVILVWVVVGLSVVSLLAQ